MTHFIKRGNIFSITSEDALQVFPKLPIGNYIVQFNPIEGFYLEEGESFNISYKVYGEIPSYTDRVLNTYFSREGSTGVLLVGEKGSGKTLMTKLISAEAARKFNTPTLIVNSSHRGDGFSRLLQQIHQPCIVLFDEFEKVYDPDEQKEILTLFDGVFPTKKLFLLTVNDPWKVDSHMKNRPGRLFYMIDFDGLSEKFIREFCQDNLDNKDHIDTLCKTLIFFEKFNFDMLKALVEEMNRYKESPKQALQFLNVRPEVRKQTYVISGTLKQKPCTINMNHWQGNPLIDYANMYIDKEKETLKKSKHPSNEEWMIFITICPEKLTLVDIQNGMYEYTFEDKEIVIKLKKEDYGKFSFKDYTF